MDLKKRIFSGVQPSGNLHIGNYLGAIKNWVELQDKYESFFCVVDLHAITVPQDPEMLRQKTLEIAKIYLAAGIDPNKSSIFVQSQVSEHAELMWILNTITKMSELDKMTQFKDKGKLTDLKALETKTIEKLNHSNIVLNSATKKMNDFFDGATQLFNMIKDNSHRDITLSNLNKTIQESFKERRYIGKVIDDLTETVQLFFEMREQEKRKEKIGVGLYDYPVLMAADILLYDTQVVPVGEDQKQHVELARDLAKRFNQKFGETFIVPEVHIKKEGMRVMGLDNPEKKMSKSAASEYNYIALIDDAETIRKKVKKAVTDSGSEIVYSDEKPALKNLINIYSSFSGKDPQEIENMYVGKGYGDFKKDLAEVIIDFLLPFQARYNAISDEQVLEILKEGAEKVRPIARKKMEEVKQKVGFAL